jgi:uncharacterized protein
MKLASIPPTRGTKPLLLVLATLLGTVACDGFSWAGDVYSKDVRSFLEIRRKNVVIQEWDLSCGAASLATILRYQHGEQVSEREIAEAMLRAAGEDLVRRRLGFSLLDLKRYLKSRGYVGDGYAELTLGDVLDLAPAIVPVRLFTYDHFVIFRGVEAGRVVLADSAYGVRTMDVRRFLAIWEKRVAFVVRRPSMPPAPNLLALPDEDLLVVSPQMVRATLPPLGGWL